MTKKMVETNDFPRLPWMDLGSPQSDSCQVTKAIPPGAGVKPLRSQVGLEALGKVIGVDFGHKDIYIYIPAPFKGVPIKP